MNNLTAQLYETLRRKGEFGLRRDLRTHSSEDLLYVYRRLDSKVSLFKTQPSSEMLVDLIIVRLYKQMPETFLKTCTKPAKTGGKVVQLRTKSS